MDNGYQPLAQRIKKELNPLDPESGLRHGLSSLVSSLDHVFGNHPVDTGATPTPRPTGPGFDQPMLQPSGAPQAKIEVVEPAHKVSREEVQQQQAMPQAGPYGSIISKYFGDQMPNALKTLQGENSAQNPRAENKYNSNGTVDRGLFQINSATFDDFMQRKGKQLRSMGINSFDDMFDPEKNAAMAKMIYDQQGWDGWYGAPADIISPTELQRRKGKGIGVRE